jgi:hypothetical protein
MGLTLLELATDEKCTPWALVKVVLEGIAEKEIGDHGDPKMNKKMKKKVVDGWIAGLYVSPLAACLPWVARTLLSRRRMACCRASKQASADPPPSLSLSLHPYTHTYFDDIMVRYEPETEGPAASAVLPSAQYGIDPLVLRRDLIKCRDMDSGDGPLVDRIRQCVGLELEYELQEMLYDLKVDYQHEKTQKELGNFKTPDAALKTAIEINGHVCHWIESKGCFGDIETMARNWSEQLNTYTTHFGPGLVIYWYDFIEDPEVDPVKNEAHLKKWRKDGILILSRLPDTVVHRPDIRLKRPPRYTEQVPPSPG